MEQPAPEVSEEVITIHDETAGEAVGLSVGADQMLNLSAGSDVMSNLSAKKTNDASNMAAAAETQEGRETSTVLNVMIEGLPEEMSATLYQGEGYSFYLTDGDWDNFVPDAWQVEKNHQIHFFVGNYEGLNKSQVERILTARNCSSMKLLTQMKQDATGMYTIRSSKVLMFMIRSPYPISPIQPLIFRIGEIHCPRFFS